MYTYAQLPLGTYCDRRVLIGYVGVNRQHAYTNETTAAEGAWEHLDKTKLCEAYWYNVNNYVNEWGLGG
jgi:hypothetical protein